MPELPWIGNLARLDLLAIKHAPGWAQGDTPDLLDHFVEAH